MRLLGADGKAHPAGLRSIADQSGVASSELLFVTSMDGEERRDLRIDLSGGADDAASAESPVSLGKSVSRERSLDASIRPGHASGRSGARGNRVGRWAVDAKRGQLLGTHRRGFLLGDRGDGHSRLRARRLPEAEGRDPLPGGRGEASRYRARIPARLGSALPVCDDAHRLSRDTLEELQRGEGASPGTGIRRQLARGHALRNQARPVRRSGTAAPGLEAQPSRPRQPLRSRLRSVLPESGDRFVQQSRHPWMGRGDGRGEGDAPGPDRRGQRLARLLPDANAGDPAAGRASS